MKRDEIKKKDFTTVIQTCQGLHGGPESHQTFLLIISELSICVGLEQPLVVPKSSGSLMVLPSRRVALRKHQQNLGVS